MSENEYHVIGQVNGYNVYTKGVDERRKDGIVGTWHFLPPKAEIYERGTWTTYGFHIDDGYNWLNIQWDSWGASDVFDIDEYGAITASIGSHGGSPIMVKLICATGNDAGVDDLLDFVEGMYDMLLIVLNEEYENQCDGTSSLSYPHYPEQ